MPNDMDGAEDDPTILPIEGEAGAQGSDDKPDPEGDEPTGDPLKDTQRKLHKMGEDNARLRELVATLGGKVDVLTTMRNGKDEEEEPSAPPVPLAELSDDEARSLLEDPKKLVDTIRAAVLGERQLIAAVLRHRDGDLLKQLKGMVPKDETRERVLTEMRKDPDFANMPDDVLMVIAKKMGRAEPRGGPGGRRVPGEPSSAVKSKASAIYKLIYGEEMKDE